MGLGEYALPYCLIHTNNAQDGREVDLLHYVFARSDIKELRGSPTKVLAAIDEYHEQFNKLMNIGPAKGAFIADIIAEHKPCVMIELGGYVGYSAILLGDALRKHGGKQYISIEKNPEMAAVSTQLVNLAGLRDTVRIEVGSSNEVLQELICETKEIDQVQLILMDHWQDLYLPDLWLLEQLNALTPGSSLVLADNVIMPGAPSYLEWVQATPLQKKDIIQRSDVGSLSPNPNLVYNTVVSEFDTTFGLVCFFFNPPRITWGNYAHTDRYRTELQLLELPETWTCSSLLTLGFRLVEIQCHFLCAHKTMNTPANTAVYLNSNGILARLVFFYQGYSKVQTHK